MLYRHGDVLIQKIASPTAEQLKTDFVQMQGLTLAYGELTGHSHRFEADANVQLWRGMGGAGDIHAEVRSPAQVIHQEHASILLEPGFYRVWIQREYSPEAIRRVRD